MPTELIITLNAQKYRDELNKVIQTTKGFSEKVKETGNSSSALQK